MKIRDKNSIFQSCLYCNQGGAVYRIEFDNSDVGYCCDKHWQEKEELQSLIKESIKESEFKVL